MDKIMEWLKGIGGKLLDFWNNYTARQKTVIIVVVSAIFLSLVLLTYFLTRPVYVELASLEDKKVASEMKTALEDAGIMSEVETLSDKMIIRVEQKLLTDASLVLAQNDNFSQDMSWETALNNTMSTTQIERQTKMRLALQNQIARGLEQQKGVNKAEVFIDEPVDNGTYNSDIKETAVSVTLDLASSTEVTNEVGKAFALWIANAAGCKTTEKIVIMDTRRNLLFSGSSANTLGGEVSDLADFKVKLQNTIAQDISDLLTKTGYNNVDVSGTGFKFDMDTVEKLSTEYSVPEGRDEGPKTNDYMYKSSGNSGTSGVPGTATNGDETDYMIEDGGSSNSETTLNKNEYAPNKYVENRKKEIGALQADISTVGIVITRYKKITEESLKEAGTLDNMTFDAYVDANSLPVEITPVPQETYDLISKSTGIPVSNIQIRAYEQPMYESEEPSGINVTNYLMIILAVLIALLLIFVIIKGTSPVEVTELEPELSVEDLLATTTETPLDELDVVKKSEAQIVVDKFVDENPEEVALLLRNWLNEDWG